MPSLYPFFFRFRAVFGKCLPNNRLAHPRGVSAPFEILDPPLPQTSRGTFRDCTVNIVIFNHWRIRVMHRNRQRFDFANFLDKTLEIDEKKDPLKGWGSWGASLGASIISALKK